MRCEVRNGPGRSRTGAALLLAVLILSLGSGYFLLHRLIDARQYQHHQRSLFALSQAREALISYAVNYQDVYRRGLFGVLPCPDLRAAGEEGNQDPTCAARNVNVLGRLPWQTLGIPPLRDGSGECLWYAVSGSWKGGSTRPLMLNADSPGMFRIRDQSGSLLHGADAYSRPVAVVVAPGAAQPGQFRGTTRSHTICAGHYQAAAYLDQGRAFANHSLSSLPDRIDELWQGASGFASENNDLLLPIFADEISAAIYRRGDLQRQLYAAGNPDALLARLGDCLAAWRGVVGRQGSPALPWPAPLALADYRSDPAYQDRPWPEHSGGIGRLPLYVDSSAAAVRAGCDEDADCASLPGDLADFCMAHWHRQGLRPVLVETLLQLWRNWKDHLFYVLSAPFAPASATTDCGGRCLRLQSPVARDAWAAILVFAGDRLTALTQSRTAPPHDTEDERQHRDNYLESLLSLPAPGRGAVLQQLETAGRFNDVLYCIRAADMLTVPCPQGVR